MHLTLATDLALRTLIYLGTKGEELSTVAEIADAFAISKDHLMKIVGRLARRGYLETVRGKGGGIRLAKPAADISIGAVVRDSGETLAVMGCLERDGFCCIECCCALKGALREAARAFMGVLERYTLKDLLTDRAPLSRALKIVAPR